MFEVLQSLESHTDALGFSLRLGRNTQYCYSLNRDQRLPDFEAVGKGILKYDWSKGECDFGYPLEVSSSVYRTEDILPFIAQFPFRNPNTLEAFIDANKSIFQKEKPFLLCFEQSAAFCTPANIVQQSWTNRASNKREYSPEKLTELFEKGYRIDLRQFMHFTPNACHQEVELSFIDASGKPFVPSPVIHEEAPLVSILILNYNGLENIKACLESIRKNTPERHEIIVVDNASTDGSLEYLRSLPDIILIENPTNVGCPPARAQAMSLAKGNYVILLDNDTIVTKGWVTRFIAHMTSHPYIGVLGPRSNYVSGAQIVPNVSYQNIDELENFASLFTQQHHGQLTPSVRLVGFCMCIRREVIDKIGSIDASFGKFGFEDDDYTWRANIAGFKTYIANDVFIHHTGGPQGRGDMQYNRQLWEAWERYKSKWNLPKDLPYGHHNSPQMLSDILAQPFDPKKHYIPVPEPSEIKHLVYTGSAPELKEPMNILSDTQMMHPVEQETDPAPHQFRTEGLVSIVILLSGQRQYSRKCVESVLKHTRESYELIFVPLIASFAPPKWLRRLLKENRNCRLIKVPSHIEGGGSQGVKGSMDSNPRTLESLNLSSQPLGFSQACNLGMAESSGEHIVLLNDAVEVTKDWLTGLLECHSSADDIGIVGPMTVNMEGRQGVKIATPSGLAMTKKESARNDTFSSRHYEESAKTDDEAISRIKLNNEISSPSARNDKKTGHCEERNADGTALEAFAKEFRDRNRYRRVYVKNVDSFCMLFSHEMAEKIGLFDERYDMPKYADKDYCFRASEEGYRNMIAGDVFVHFHGHHRPDSRTADIASLLNKDRRVFIEQWIHQGGPEADARKRFSMDSLFLADELRQKGEKGNAVVTLRQGIDAYPDDKRLYFALAELLIDDGKFKEALNVLEHLPEGIKNDVMALELMGYCKEGLRQLTEAEQYADEVLNMRTSAGALNLKGTLAFAKLLYPDAERFFQKALDADMGYGESYSNLGALKWSHGKKEDAFTLFEKAFVLSSTSEDIVINYYSAAVDLGKLPEAEKRFREAIGLYPFCRKLQFILIDNLLQQGLFRQAMDEIQKALIAFGIDDDTLNLALKLRQKVGVMEIRSSRGSFNRMQGEMGSIEGENADIARNADPDMRRDRTTKQSHSDIETEEIATPSEADRNVKKEGTISLCMIAKNEEQNIMHALQSVQPVIDEMIVVDTGSTDRTKKIARVFGATVHDFPWTDNFSDARNFSISKATGDWILLLDADEVIAASDYERLRELITEGSRGRGFKDLDKLQQTVIARSTSSPVIARSEATTQSHLEQRDRHAPLAMTTQKGHCEEQRDDTIPSSNPFRHCEEHGDEAIPPFNANREIATPPFTRDDKKGTSKPSVAYSFVSRNYVGEVCVNWYPNDGKYREEAGSGWFPSRKVRLFPNDSRIRFENPVHEMVENSLKKIGIDIKPTEIPIHHYGKLMKHHVLAKGELYYQMGRKKLSKQGEKDPVALYELAVQASELEKFDEALEYWQQLIAIRPDIGKAYYGLGTSYYSLGRYEEALSSYKKALQLSPDSIDASFMYATCELYAGNPDAAIRALKNIHAIESDNPLVVQLLAVSYFCSDRKDEGFEYAKKSQDSMFNPGPYFTNMAEQLISLKRFDYASRLLEATVMLGLATEKTRRLLAECRQRDRHAPPAMTTKDRLPHPLRSPAMTTQKDHCKEHLFPRHCEERSDEAISSFNANREIATPPARDEDYGSHCEERSDEAIPSFNTNREIATPPARDDDKRQVASPPPVASDEDYGSHCEEQRDEAISSFGTTPQSPRSIRDDLQEEEDRPFRSSSNESHTVSDLRRSQTISDSQSPNLNEAPSLSVSLCMIAKNEQDNIARALMSVKGLADEMIVVDTGSTDRTKDIATALGAKVYDFAWTDSFSDARNFSLSKATGKWILILDADEAISSSDYGRLRELITEGSRGRGFKDLGKLQQTVIARRTSSPVIARNAVTKQSHSEQRDRHAPPAMTTKDRLPHPLRSPAMTTQKGHCEERSDEAISSVNANREIATPPAHDDSEEHADPESPESLNPAAVAYTLVSRNYVVPVNTSGWIKNDGAYASEEAGTGWFHGEKVRLFPNDPRIRFEDPVHERIEPSLTTLGISVQRSEIPVHHYGLLDEEKMAAKHEYYFMLGKERLVQKGGDDAKALFDLAVQASGIGKYPEALEYLEKAVSKKPDFSNALESMGNVNYNLGRYAEAISAYNRAMQISPVSRDTVVHYATCEVFTGAVENAIARLEALLQKEPGYPKAMTALAMVLICTGQKEKGFAYINALREMNFSPATYFSFFARQFIDTHLYKYAASLLEAAIETGNFTADTQKLLVECRKKMKASGDRDAKGKGGNPNKADGT
ncbi:MAG: glycosyltransferase [Nitrospirota bacterium]